MNSFVSSVTIRVIQNVLAPRKTKSLLFTTWSSFCRFQFLLNFISFVLHFPEVELNNGTELNTASGTDPRQNGRGMLLNKWMNNNNNKKALTSRFALNSDISDIHTTNQQIRNATLIQTRDWFKWVLRPIIRLQLIRYAFLNFPSHDCKCHVYQTTDFHFIDI